MIKKYGLYYSWLIAIVGSLISLYFSEIKHMEPCHLCWYQRVCLFPLSYILGLATYRCDLSIARYALPLALIGFFLAIYQVGLQEIPGWNPIDICGAGPSCSTRHIIWGPITIPMLSASGFFMLSLLLSLVHKEDLSHPYKIK